MISEWIELAAKECAVPVSRLTVDDVNQIVEKITSRYVINARAYLWESFAGEVSCKRPDGWRVICEFGMEQPILLYQDDDRFEGYMFSSSTSLRSILCETPGFEFYVTNSDADFVLCHNHHDYLIGVGSCRSWLEAICRECPAES